MEKIENLGWCFVKDSFTLLTKTVLRNLQDNGLYYVFRHKSILGYDLSFLLYVIFCWMSLW